MFQRKTMLIATAIFLAVGNSSSIAASCSPKSAEEVKQLLVTHSPFRGEWKMGVYSGPTEFHATPSGFAVRSSGVDRVLGPGTSVQVNITRNGVSYQTNAGPTNLKLRRDCSLKGTQRHPNGRVSIHLDAAG